MNLDLGEQLRRRLKAPLPGPTAQRRMAPQPLPHQANRWDAAATNCREASVLLLLYPHATTSEVEWHVVLMRRPDYPGVHGGQVSLPGGQREGDETLAMTALREAHEEVGLLPTHVELLGQLSQLYTPPSNYCIYPFVGLTSQRPKFIPNPAEVAALIECPLSRLQDRFTRQQERWTFGNEVEREVPFFNVAGHKVWGATAMILSEFLAVLDQIPHKLEYG